MTEVNIEDLFRSPELCRFHRPRSSCFSDLYLPLLHEGLHLLLWRLFVPPELVFHVLITQSLQINGQEPMKNQDPFIQRPDLGHVGQRCHGNRLSGPEVKIGGESGEMWTKEVKSGAKVVGGSPGTTIIEQPSSSSALKQVYAASAPLQRLPTGAGRYCTLEIKH